MKKLNRLTLTVLFASCLLGKTIYAQNNWAWMNGSSTNTNVLPAFGIQSVPSGSNTPGNLYGAATWTDNSGNLWLFGGYCSGYGYNSDLWKYIPSTNEWTWVKGSGTPNHYGVYGSVNTPSTPNTPGGRYLCSSWTDNSGNLWLFGGSGYAANTTGYLSDLWKYNPSTNLWTWMKGPNSANNAGSYGTQAVASPSNMPGGRFGYTPFKDNTGNLWLFGGYGYAANTATVGNLNDLWKYEVSTGNWVWMKGSNVLDQTGIYGTVTVASPTVMPGGMRAPVSWSDVNGDFWLFGGYGTITSTVLTLTNDLWKYSVSTGNWTWMRGPGTPNSFGWYGSQGVAASNNDPGARYYSTACGSDNLGNLWLFGGYGYSASSASKLNDLWKYDKTTNQWTWMRGSSVPNQNGSYGIQTVPASTNNPGGRYLQMSWMDSNGRIWIYGGYGQTSTSLGYLNDMWRFDVCNAPAPPLNISAVSGLSICSGVSATLSASSTSSVNWYPSATATNAVGSGSLFATAPLTATGSSSIIAFYAESFSCSASASRTAFNVTVNPTPTLSVNSGSICSGSPFVILPSGAATYSVSGGSQVVYPTTNTSYTVTGTSAQGCEATQAVVSQVTVSPLPLITAPSGSVCTGSSFVIVPGGATTYSITGGTATVSPASNTLYLVTGTSSMGCVSSSPAVVSVMVYSASPISVNDGTVCIGDSFTLTPSGGVSYTYSGGSAVVSPSAPTIYTVYGANSFGCVSSTVSSVGVYTLPVVSVNSGSICSGDSFTLIPSGALSYTYSSGSPVISPGATTTFTVFGSDANGCVGAVTTIINVDACTGLGKNSQFGMIKIYPNPSSDHFFVETNSPAKLLLFNELGQLLITKDLVSGKNQIQTSTLTEGLYLLKISDGIQETTFRISNR